MTDTDLDNVNARFKPIPAPRLTPAHRLDRALIVLVDVSGSMSDPLPPEATKLHAAWKAMKAGLVPNLERWHLGIITFGTLGPEGDGVRWLFTPGNPDDPLDIPEPSPQGDTPLLPALKMAWQWLYARVQDKRIIVISDGLPNQGGSSAAVLEAARGHMSTPVDTIAVGSGIAGWDPDFLRRLSEITGGIFRKVEDTQDLGKALLQLSPKLRPQLSPGKLHLDKP